ncbi:hypothetical protein PCP41_15770 [Pseudomonas aeruginosa]|uniref:hypothetical protein n=1 Tax=Pseudomonas aeruginosa TaxID=287 RepID=UPI002288E864|nr:hypothetical protein [Pseudomonas aeruginosa]HCT7633435.1 hypothetical protein [Pseudomonas aeruginosa]
MEIPDTLADHCIEIETEIVEGGRKYTIYRDGKLWKVARLLGDPAERVAGFQALLTDIYKMQSYLSLACEIYTHKLSSELQLNIFDSGNRDQVVCSSLYLSAVSLYGKCFTNPKGRKAKLEESELKKRLSDKQLQTHNRLTHLRHNWTAHGGNSDHELLVSVVAFSSDGRAIPLYLAQSTAITPIEEMQGILELCDPMIELVEELKAKNEANVFKNKDKLAFLKELRSHAADYIVVPDISQSGAAMPEK